MQLHLQRGAPSLHQLHAPLQRSVLRAASLTTARHQRDELAYVGKPPAAPRCSAGGGWRQEARRQRHRCAAAAAPRDDFDKERFEANNKNYAVLTQQIEDTAAEVVEGLGGTSLFLVGMMGSGKSTVGKILAQALQYCYFDTDSLIEQATGRKVSQLFAEDGEESFREAETDVLAELAPFRNCVVSTGGGVPTRSVNWGHMQGGVTVWLNGPPALLAHRVVGDGTESRPLLAQQQQQQDGAQPDADEAYTQALARLTALLEERRAVYQCADLTVSLEAAAAAAPAGSAAGGAAAEQQQRLGAPPAEVAFRVLAALNQRIKGDAEERRRRMDFEIVQGGELPKTMEVRMSPAAMVEKLQQEEDPLLP